MNQKLGLLISGNESSQNFFGDGSLNVLKIGDEFIGLFRMEITVIFIDFYS